MKKFYRDTDNSILCGVCSGVAKHFNIDVTIVRLLFVIALFYWVSSPLTLIYLVLAIIAPTKHDIERQEKENKEDEK